jgi:hypothetical protein
MSRLDYVTIAIVAVCVAALIYLIYMTTNLLGGNDPAPEVATVTTDDPYDDNYYDGESAAYDEDSSAVDDAGYEEPTYDDASDYQGDYETDGESEGGYADEEASPAEDNYADNRETASSKPASSSEDYASVSKGSYMVLAGTFKYKANAETMVRKLQKMGYSDARSELFDRGTYAVALVDHYPDYADAKRTADELKGKGVAAYVKKK